MKILKNPLRGTGISADVDMARGTIRADPEPVRGMIGQCPAYKPTPLLDRPDLAASLGIASLHLKDERARMGLGSFKALGGAYAVATIVRDHAPSGLSMPASKQAAAGVRVICASAGNHGLSVAAGARVFGAKASIYLSESVPESFSDRLRGQDADVVRAGAIYEESMAAAAEAANRGEGVLISDSTWPGYVDPALTVLAGYTVLAAEITDEMTLPTHIFLQAGVGGMASAVAATLRGALGASPFHRHRRARCRALPDGKRARGAACRGGRAGLQHGPPRLQGTVPCRTRIPCPRGGCLRDRLR